MSITIAVITVLNAWLSLIGTRYSPLRLLLGATGVLKRMAGLADFISKGVCGGSKLGGFFFIFFGLCISRAYYGPKVLSCVDRFFFFFFPFA